MSSFLQHIEQRNTPFTPEDAEFVVFYIREMDFVCNSVNMALSMGIGMEVEGYNAKVEAMEGSFGGSALGGTKRHSKAAEEKGMTGQFLSPGALLKASERILNARSQGDVVVVAGYFFRKASEAVAWTQVWSG